MIWPLVPYSYRTVAWDLPAPAPSPPDSGHWLGTDDQARDVVARVIYGFRISVLFGFILTIISAVIGVAAGAVQGYFGGWVDLLAQRFIEIWAGMPTLYLLIILASVVEPNFSQHGSIEGVRSIGQLLAWCSFGIAADSDTQP